MTGRHQGRAGGPRRRWAAIAGVLAADAAVVAFTLGNGPDGSSRAVTPVQRATSEPTYGEYVAPEAGPQAETLTPPPPTPPPAPAPAVTPRGSSAPKKTEPTRQRRDCRWEDVPFLERWCHWRGRGDR
ncbi:hypothetical protein [Actinomadura sp. CNU-125]|uniref:hypothetical protein n=1 Tax=Actinomadura sp. CNU-125 TaxID=1904961 RepID=UPI001178ADF3|nr:hypothetical protein [Actinomadura sp. CNU-125]